VLVMIANQSGREARELAVMYPGAIGHLYSPGGQRGPFPCFPYALDNGAFAAFKNATQLDTGSWMRLLDWAASKAQRPLWALVPDCVGDRGRTLELWDEWKGAVTSREIPAAFAAQDGMTPRDVPIEASVVFIGGTLAWKWSALRSFSDAGLRLHVGRVNTLGGLDACLACGVESVDGTGWFRGNRRQLARLISFLKEQHHGNASRLPYPA
jgi:hypothetical protein